MSSRTIATATPWSCKPAWPSRSNADARALALAAAGALALSALGCGDGMCGPGDAPIDGVLANVAGETITYGNFTSSPNNDCTSPGGQVTSLTIESTQLDPQPSIALGITLCIPQPDAIDSTPVPLDDLDRLQLIDIFAELPDGCLVQLDRTRAIAGTAWFEGYCGDGSAASGYALAFDAVIPVTRTCDGQPDTLELSGRTAVEALNF